MPAPVPAPRAEYWTRMATAWRHSGLTQAEFCRRRGIPLHTFRDRLYRRLPGHAPARSTPAVPAPAPRFLPVRLVAQAAAPERPEPRPIEVLLDGGRRIAVAPGFDPETLRRLVDALEGEGPAC